MSTYSLKRQLEMSGMFATYSLKRQLEISGMFAAIDRLRHQLTPSLLEGVPQRDIVIVVSLSFMDCDWLLPHVSDVTYAGQRQTSCD